MGQPMTRRPDSAVATTALASPPTEAGPTGHAATDGYVSIRSLEKLYGDVRAVDGVSLDISEGEFLALLGPSGSGKTTVLMCVAGFETANDGQILIGGTDMTKVPPHRRDLGMVFQRYALFPHLSVEDNIAFPLKRRRLPRAERRRKVDEALELVQLQGLGKRRPGQLSGGQQQRVALARAIVFGPRVLLMDEPLGALDKKLREQLQIEVKQLQRRLGTTVIYVTHDQQEALTMADRIAIMHQGQLQQLGTPDELYEHPANAFTANFVGETSLLAATVADLGDDRCTVTLAGGQRLPAVAADPATLHPGAAVRVAVRPERVRIVGSSHAPNVTGTVTASFYSGESTLYLVDIGGGAELKVRASVNERAFSAGDEIAVSWNPEHARVYLR
jgi:spermidine/putrescine ABC transporter ATP-binding subunit